MLFVCHALFAFTFGLSNYYMSEVMSHLFQPRSELIPYATKFLIAACAQAVGGFLANFVVVRMQGKGWAMFRRTRYLQMIGTDAQEIDNSIQQIFEQMMTSEMGTAIEAGWVISAVGMGSVCRLISTLGFAFYTDVFVGLGVIAIVAYARLMKAISERFIDSSDLSERITECRQNVETLQIGTLYNLLPIQFSKRAQYYINKHDEHVAQLQKAQGQSESRKTYAFLFATLSSDIWVAFAVFCMIYWLDLQSSFVKQLPMLLTSSLNVKQLFMNLFQAIQSMSRCESMVTYDSKWQEFVNRCEQENAVNTFEALTQRALHPFKRTCSTLNVDRNTGSVVLQMEKDALPFIKNGERITDKPFRLPPGKAIKVGGESGIGKSTTVTSVVKRATDHYQRIAFMMQRSILSKGPMIENLLQFVDENQRAQINEQEHLIPLLQRLGLWKGVIADLPKQLHTIHSTQQPLMSGGQLQRFLLAAALIQRPHLLVMDEPTSALDAHNELLFCQTLQYSRKHLLPPDACILCVSHSAALDNWFDIKWHISTEGIEAIDLHPDRSWVHSPLDEVDKASMTSEIMTPSMIASSVLSMV